MRVTIVGAGAIGGLAGAYMTRAGFDVMLVDRWIEHVDAMNERGLFIDGIRGEQRVEVRATTPERLEGPLEAVLVATKSQHTLDAVRQLLPLVGPETFIVSFQNGFNEPGIAELLGDERLGGLERVLGSIPNYGGALVDPGHIEHVHEGPIQLGEMDGTSSQRLAELAAMLGTLTEVQLSSNVWGQIWAKEVYSAQVVFSALVDAPIARTLGDERYATDRRRDRTRSARDRRRERDHGRTLRLLRSAELPASNPRRYGEASCERQACDLAAQERPDVVACVPQERLGHLVGHRLSKPPLRGPIVQRKTRRVWPRRRR